MSEPYFTLLIQLTALFPFLVLAGILSKMVQRKFLFQAIILIVIDFIVLMFARKIPGLQIPDLHYNWFGKVGSILLSVGIFCLLPDVRAGSGLRLKQKTESTKAVLVLLGILGITGFCIGLMNDKESLRLENFSFQLLMPSLDEELMFRGILFYWFSQAFVPKGEPARQNYIAAGIVTVWFGIVHSIAWKAGAPQFDIMTFIVTGSIGAILMALRMISGNLVAPMVGHSLFNVLIQVGKILP